MLGLWSGSLAWGLPLVGVHGCACSVLEVMKPAVHRSWAADRVDDPLNMENPRWEAKSLLLMSKHGRPF